LVDFQVEEQQQMSNDFDEFVKNQVSNRIQKETLDLDKEKRMWIAKLDELYALIDKSLGNHLKEGSIKITMSDLVLHEEMLGAYTVKAAQISLGNYIVKLKPIGTFLIGARGRVDMIGPRDVTRFAIVPPDAKAPKVTITTIEPGSKPPSSTPSVSPEEWVWKISTPPPRINYIELTEDSFRTALMGVVNG
jgi:hypothetical protein